MEKKEQLRPLNKLVVYTDHFHYLCDEHDSDQDFARATFLNILSVNNVPFFMPGHLDAHKFNIIREAIKVEENVSVTNWIEEYTQTAIVFGCSTEQHHDKLTEVIDKWLEEDLINYLFIVMLDADDTDEEDSSLKLDDFLTIVERVKVEDEYGSCTGDDDFKYLTLDDFISKVKAVALSDDTKTIKASLLIPSTPISSTSSSVSQSLDEILNRM